MNEREMNHRSDEQQEEAPGSPRKRRHYLLNRLLTFLLLSRRALLLGLLAAGTGLFLAAIPLQARSALLASLHASRRLVFLLLFFSLLMLSLLWSAGQDMDSWLFLYINQNAYRTVWLDRILLWITQIGNGAFSFLLVGIFYLFGQREFALELLFGTLTLWFTVEAVKALAERSRPFYLIEEANLVGWRERGKSFPSGHSSQAFFMASLISHVFQAGLLLNVVLYGLAILVAFSRVYIGVHYPRDILAGAILGSVWALLSILIQPYWIVWF